MAILTLRRTTLEIMANDDPELVKRLQGQRGELTSVCFDVNNKFLASSSLDSTLMLWKLTQDGALRFLGHKSGITDVSFSPSGKLVASCSRDKTIRLWIPKVQSSSTCFKAHTSTIRSVQFSPDGQLLISSSDDKMVKLWNVSKRRFLRTFTGHSNWVRCANFSPNGKTVVSCADDKTVRLWDVGSNKQIHVLNEITGYGLYVAFHPNGWCIGVGLSNGVVKIYDIRVNKLLQHYGDHTDSISKLSFHPTGKYMLTTSRDAAIKILDILEGRAIYTIEGHKGAITCCAFNLEGDHFATGGIDHQVLMWKTNFDRNDVMQSTVVSARSDKGNNTDTDSSSDRRLSFPVGQSYSDLNVQVINVDCTSENKSPKEYNIEDFQERDSSSEIQTQSGVQSQPLTAASTVPEPKYPEKLEDSAEDSVTLKEIYRVVSRLDQRIEKAETNLHESMDQLRKRVEILEMEIENFRR